jgi:succinate dehydrogenase/fumarate reductase-like Fe-S protein
MAALDTKWWHAQLNLAYRVVLHYLRKLWPWAPRFGRERFLHNYVPEGLPPATPAWRDIAHEPGRCTLCGACDEACPLMLERSRAEFLGPMQTIASAARAAPHLEDVAQTLSTMTSDTCTSCRLCEPACPEDIPILTLAAALDAQRDVIERARAGDVRLALPEA